MGPEPSIAARQTIQRLLINRDYARLWAASAISGFGDSIFETTLIVWIVEDLAENRSWAPYVTSGLLAASALPVLLVGPIAGTLFDRWRDKRRVLLRTNLVSAALVMSLLPVAVAPASAFGGGAQADAIRLNLTLIVVVLASAVVQFLRPASGVLSRDIVPEEERPRAVGMSQTAANVTMLVAPAVAAPVLIAFGPGLALTVNAATFVVAFFMIRSIAVLTDDVPGEPVELASAGSIRNDLAVGLRFFIQNQVLKSVAIAMSIAMLGFGAMSALDIYFMLDSLGTDRHYYGILESAQGAGMIAGAIAWGFLAGRLGLERTVWLGLAGLGLMTVVYSRLTAFPPALVLTVIIGTIVPSLSIAISPILMPETPRHLLGRIGATLNPIITGSTLVGALLGGVLCGAMRDNFEDRILGVHVGPIDTIYVVIGVMTLIAATYSARNLRAPRLVVSDCETGSG